MQGLAKQRAEFFLDPWNTPYWVRDICARHGRQRSVMVYNFGPNRRRESDHDVISGDDLGLIVLPGR